MNIVKTATKKTKQNSTSAEPAAERLNNGPHSVYDLTEAGGHNQGSGGSSGRTRGDQGGRTRGDAICVSQPAGH